MGETLIGKASDLPPGKVIGVGGYVVGNAGGRYFALSRRCRHLFADLARGKIDKDGCLVCPWHASKYDVETGRPLETVRFSESDPDPHGLVWHDGALYSCDAGIHPGWPENKSPTHSYIFRIDLL